MPAGDWAVPRCFEGRTVAILASGPSMSQQVADAVRAASVAAIAVNTTYRLAPWAWMLYAADAEWWLHPNHADALLGFGGLKAHAQGPSGADLSARGVRVMRVTGINGFDPDPGTVRTGATSGYQAVHVAMQAGASRILLCGLDMREVDGLSHWHGKHPQPLRESAPDNLSRWARRFETLVEPAAARGVRILNCTLHSAVRCFPFMDLEEALRAVEVGSEDPSWVPI